MMAMFTDLTHRLRSPSWPATCPPVARPAWIPWTPCGTSDVTLRWGRPRPSGGAASTEVRSTAIAAEVSGSCGSSISASTRFSAWRCCSWCAASRRADSSWSSVGSET